MENDGVTRRLLLYCPALAAAALIAGCASKPIPESQLAVSRSAISNALTAGAAESAPLELENARTKMARANAAVAAEKYQEAKRLAEEAELDARLAAARASTAQASAAALEIQKSIGALRENLNSNAQGNQLDMMKGTP